MVFHPLKTVTELCCLSLLKKIRNLPQRDFSFAEIMLSFFCLVGLVNEVGYFALRIIPFFHEKM